MFNTSASALFTRETSYLIHLLLDDITHIGICRISTHYKRRCKILKVGSIVLSIWSGFNFLLASFILILIIFLKKNAPILLIVLEEPEISKLDPRVISTANSLAILFNSCAAVFSLLVLFVIWSSLINKQKWAFWALLVTIGFSQLLAFVADAIIGNRTVPVNIAFSVLYLVGIGLAGYSIFK